VCFLLPKLTLILYSFGFVEYRTVDEAKSVHDNPEDLVLDGHVLFIRYGKVY